MKLDLIAIGRMKSGPERDLADRYAGRLRQQGRSVALDGPRLIELGESPARRDIDRKQEEASAILAALGPGYRLIALDEEGEMPDSDGFAARLRRYRDDGIAGLALVIGGADGLGEAVLTRADFTLSFGRLTMPHQLVRVVVLEQLYRAATILAGHPYHRA